MADQAYVETVTTVAPRVRRASWGAIFAGVFVTIVVQAMFTLLGAGIGFAIIEPSRQPSGQSIALGSAIWLVVSSLISTWIGACVAGRLSGGPLRTDGMLHGIVTWSVSTVVMVMFLTTAVGGILSGAASLLSSALPQTSQTGGGSVASAEESIRGMFPQTGALLPPTGRTQGEQMPGQLTELAQQDKELEGALTRLESSGGVAQAPQARDQVINLLVTKHNLSQQDANSLVNQWDQQFQQLRGQTSGKVQQAGQATAHGISVGALGGFIALLLSLLVSSWGGWVGTASLPRGAIVASQPVV